MKNEGFFSMRVYLTIQATNNCVMCYECLFPSSTHQPFIINVVTIDCIVTQSFSISRPFLINFMYTLKINKNSYFYYLSRILCLSVISRVLQHVINTSTLVLSPTSTSISSKKKVFITNLYIH